MEVIRQLLTERAGHCRTQFTFCWDGQRLRLASGHEALPKKVGRQARAA